MNTTILFIIIIWILLGYITSTKQYKASVTTEVETPEIEATVAFILAPVWLIGAIINQVFIKDWK